MDAHEIRRRFTDFYTAREHRWVPSGSLVPPAWDTSVLITTAGMQPFKRFFLGLEAPPAPRLTSIQKVFRTVDIEEVGRTARHLTFFEMLGNFSFGDYFKQDACRWAWQLVTEKFLLEPGRLWATVYETDEEAAEIWAKVGGGPAGRILRR